MSCRSHSAWRRGSYGKVKLQKAQRTNNAAFSDMSVRGSRTMSAGTTIRAREASGMGMAGELERSGQVGGR
ncbi:hypothetical protein D3C72_2461440 [compost metagenome]